MNDSKFIERIKVKIQPRIKRFENREIKAKRIIRNFDKTLQNKTYKNTRQRSAQICHFRENEYNNRRVVQASFLTVGCQMKKAGSRWNCNYGALDNCLITPNQYVTAFKNGINKTYRRCSCVRSFWKYNRS